MSIPSLPNSPSRFRRISHASSRFSYDAVWSAVEETVNIGNGSVSSYHRMQRTTGSFQTNFTGKSFAVGFSPFDDGLISSLNCTVDGTPSHGFDCVSQTLPPGDHRVKWDMWTNPKFIGNFRLYHLDYEPISVTDDALLAGLNTTVVLNLSDKNVTWDNGWNRTVTDDSLLMGPNTSVTVTFTGVGFEWNCPRKFSGPMPSYSLDGSEPVEFQGNSLTLQDLCYETHNITVQFPNQTVDDIPLFGGPMPPRRPEDSFEIHLPSANSSTIICAVEEPFSVTDDGPLTAGQMVGLAIGSVLILLLTVAGSVFYFWRRRRRRRNQNPTIPFFEKPTTFGAPSSSGGSLASSSPTSSIGRQGYQMPNVNTHSFESSQVLPPIIRPPIPKSRELPSSPKTPPPTDLPKVPKARPLPTEPDVKDPTGPTSTASAPAIQHIDSGLRLATTDISLPSRAELPPLYSAT